MARKVKVQANPELRALAQDMLTAFSTPSGSRVFDHLRQLFDDRLSYVPGDSYATAFREGQRSVLVHIHNLMTIAKTGTPPGKPVEVEGADAEEES